LTTSEVGADRLFSKWTMSSVSPGSTVSAGPGTVTVPQVALTDPDAHSA
jgi:hypothetical protein